MSTQFTDSWIQPVSHDPDAVGVSGRAVGVRRVVAVEYGRTRGHRTARLPEVFDDPSRMMASSEWRRQRVLGCILASGHPEVLGIESAVARPLQCAGYPSTVINRDIRDFATMAHGGEVRQVRNKR